MATAAQSWYHNISRLLPCIKHERSVMLAVSPPRLVPERPFPPYSFVPGLFPHPISDPAGHSYGQPHPTPLPLDVDQWAANADYLFGIDLFNHGYYWEAHEVWEGLWHACGRAGILGDMLKGLIQLT